ncbi:glycerol transport system ATP-binding protein [Chitinivorax tropicus]|uniref:Glycerol transport system ATP-binding protein n=1 Tax=Chitinivorax tropicus TaxID=714531 RepID=A0A840ML81_9PROT|nr:ABC transporter ATP-binding protein [Chitinivorax tropicus]MBB5017637.1 glycerol transport system ATP-binding protein [Chitinivorax tropicus]
MLLKLNGVSKRVAGETHLYPLDLVLAPGEINVLLGPTRAGKTTLMRLMAGLDHPTTGQVVDNGVDVTGVSVRKRNLAMVYQQFVNYPSFTVFDNIASPLRLQGGIRADEIRRRVGEMADKLHIAHLLDRLPGELSGGQQQRTALARALVKQAPLLLLDEPLVNLDYKLREALRTELKQLFAHGSTTVVYATTEPQEALLLGGHTAVLDEGRLLQYGPTLDVFHTPSSMRVAQVFSDPPMNLLPVTVQPDERQLMLGHHTRLPLVSHLTQLNQGPAIIGIRPSHVRLQPRHADDHPLICDVDLAEVSGSDTYLHAHHAGLALVAQLPGVQLLPPGSQVTVYLNPADMFAFAADGPLLASPHRHTLAAMHQASVNE